MPPGIAPYEVFISSAPEDRRLADKVAGHLRRDGIRVRRFADSLGSGSWHFNEPRALRDSKVVVFIITPHSDTSAACRDEAQRAANPTGTETVPVPLVVGAWTHESSDLWLLLNRWNGVLASPDLTDEALHQLTMIVHGRLGFLPAASLSTGQALAAVKDDLCAYLENFPGTAADKLLERTRELQVRHRGNMVEFAQLTYLDRELLVAGLISTPEKRTAYISAYLRAFFHQVVADAHSAVATRLARHISFGDVIVVPEYSRVLLQAFRIVADTDHRLMQSLRIGVIGRTGMPLAGDEPSRMASELTNLGADTRSIHFGQWIDYLRAGTDEAGIGPVNKLLFGVEAFGVTGDVVFPQIVNELDALQSRRSRPGGSLDFTVIAAGESYRVCRDPREISKMISDPHYTVGPSSLFDYLVTDVAEFRLRDHAHVSLNACVEHVERCADEIRATVWPSDEPLPIWNAPRRKLTAVKAVATDVDGTVTTGGRIAPSTLAMFERLQAAGRKVILVTGRSAGWGAALASYLPGISGVIAENGAVLILAGDGEVSPVILDQSLLDDGAATAASLEAGLAAVLAAHPGAKPGADNHARISDRTVEVGDDIDPETVARIADEYGLNHTFSTVHHHLSRSSLNKKTGLLLALSQYIDRDIKPGTQVVTIGDSINDVPLFEPGVFAATFGVRSALRTLSGPGVDAPAYVSLADGGAGFNEIGELIVRAR